MLSSTSVLIVDDHGIVRDGVGALLKPHKNITIVGSAATGHAAILAAQKLAPDVIIMDLMLPDMNGIDVTQQILKLLPRTRVIVLSACHTMEHVYRAMRAGATGYLIKDALGGELVHAVHTVKAGIRFLSSSLAPNFIESHLNIAHRKSPLERLSARERDVLQQVVAGGSSAEIGRHMSLSPKTIDTYRGRLMTKLGVTNRSALIRFALQHELSAL
jgi:DNA-binding NarL/FixJ family response regulator